MFAYFGHHKCASTWIDNIVKDVAADAGYVYRGVVDHETPSGHGQLTDYVGTFRRHELGAHLEREGVDFLGALTADWAHVEGLSSVRGFHVIRDPRDLIVSAYFSHRFSHPTAGLPHLAAHRRRLEAVSKEKGLLLEMEFSARELRDLGEWHYDHPDILEIKMEDLTADPYRGFLRIFEFLGLLAWDSPYALRDRIAVALRMLRNRVAVRRPALATLRQPMEVTGDLLLGRVYDHRFEKKAQGRTKGREDKASHYRKGKAGDWRNHFTDEHVAAFKEMFGDLVVRLGYDTTNGWKSGTAGNDRIREMPVDAA